MVWNIIALVISIGSLIAAAIASYFAYRNNYPKIKVKIDKDNCVFTPTLQFFAISIEILNVSPVAGTISNIYAKYKDEKYYSKIIGEEFDVTSIGALKKDSRNKVEARSLILETPITILPFTYRQGFIVFPKLCSDRSYIDCTIYFETIGGNKIKSILIRGRNIEN